MEAHQVAEQAARQSYGKLIAWLSWKWGDIASAEDALAEAFEKALKLWPVQGIPASPDAWLATVAHRQLLQLERRRRILTQETLCEHHLTVDELQIEPSINDQRLALMFVCAHPALDRSIHSPLMLQTVLGVQAQEIASSLLLSPRALAQRLVRAKRKIRSSGIRFEHPTEQDLPQRLHSVLEAIYAAYGLGWDSLHGAEKRVIELGPEALYLSGLVCNLQPKSAEALGLHALINFCESRRKARVTEDGLFVPLAEQSIDLWDRSMIKTAEKMLWRASKLNDTGPFQLEAAIQSAHCQRLFGNTPWPSIAQLYQRLNLQHATVGSLVSEAVACCELENYQRAQEILESIPREQRDGYQPWWVARAYLHRKLGQNSEAHASYTCAMGLSQHQSIRQYLQTQQAATSVEKS